MVGYSPWRFSARTPFRCVLVNARAGKEEEMWDSAHILCKQQEDGSLTIEVLVCLADTFRASSRRRSRSGAWMLAGEENSREQTQDGPCPWWPSLQDCSLCGPEAVQWLRDARRIPQRSLHSQELAVHDSSPNVLHHEECWLTRTALSVGRKTLYLGYPVWIGTTFAACGPLGPGTTSNSTRSPSFSVR